MKLALIVNPTASSVTARSRVVIQKALSADHDVTVIETTRQRHATRLAHQLQREGFDVIVPLGGDGTVNEVANGILDSGTAVAPLPGGSTNVFARALGYPNDPTEATAVLLEALAQRSMTGASVGVANGRAFLFHVGVGFDAAVVERVERRGPLKRYAGHPWFVASAIRTWLSSDRKNISFTVQEDSPDSAQRSVVRAQMAVALNLNPYTFLGNRPLDLAPEVTLDSELSLVTLESVNLLRLIPAAQQALLSGEGIPNREGMHHWDSVRSARIVSETPFPYQLDGEPQEPVTELHLEHKPDALRLVVPVGTA